MKSNKIFTPLLILFFCSTLFVQCKNASNENASERSEMSEETSETATSENLDAKEMCFRREFPYQDNPEMKDIQELMITIEGTDVLGTYNWLPAEKDKRTGTFKGTVNGKTITAEYLFMQEGQQAQEPITITLSTNEAVVTSANKSLGLDATLPQIPCKME